MPDTTDRLIACGKVKAMGQPRTPPNDSRFRVTLDTGQTFALVNSSAVLGALRDAWGHDLPICISYVLDGRGNPRDERVSSDTFRDAYVAEHNNL